MNRGIRVVAPFRFFPPESDHHLSLQDFDWMDALRMMAHSVELSCQNCTVHAITDVDTNLPIPALKYQTHERRLMLWSLEVCVKYLESDDFDRNTVMLDTDQLVYQDLATFFAKKEMVDLGLLIRPKTSARVLKRRLLNGVQFWHVRGRDRLVGFYRHALDVARTLPDDIIAWGADSDAVSLLLEPISMGIQERSGVTVKLMDYARVMEALSTDQIRWLGEGRMPRPTRAVLDFRNKRKRYLSDVYRATIAAHVEAIA